MHPDFLCLAGPTTWSRGALIVVAHPDDETIGAGGAMPHLPIRGIVLVTDGAPADRRWWGDSSFPSREAYARTRREELACALAVAGLDARCVRAMGVQDLRASYHLPRLAKELARIVRALDPGVILTHPYEGGHPDHDAVAFAVYAASRLTGQEPPSIVEFTSYHTGAEGEPVAGRFLPLHAQPSLPAFAVPGPVGPYGDLGEAVSLPATGFAGAQGEIAFSLSPDDRARKRRMMQCFASQGEVLARWFPVTGVERFRIAPTYDFTRPPHRGTLKYERLDWGITGADWRAHAAAALSALEGAPRDMRRRR
ncbi:MAG: PIG-L family deacetylase [Longimicrobiaceae bacterium]